MSFYNQGYSAFYEEDKMKQADSVAIVSGGLDSTVLVYDMIENGYKPHLLSFDYGQRHKKELQFAKFTAKNLGLRHDIVDLTGLTHLISNSALTQRGAGLSRSDAGLAHPENPKIEVPEGHYAEDTMKATVVPNRNMIMLSIAAGVAVNNKYRCIGTGVHAGDHFVYPDCRPKFIFKAGQAIKAGNEGFHKFDLKEDMRDLLVADKVARGLEVQGDEGIHPIYAPFIDASKADIAYRGLELGVPFHLTWSCYKGGEHHCGRCGTCVERLEAIHEAQQRRLQELKEATNGSVFAVSNVDQTMYEDDEFWKAATRNATS